MIQIPRAYLPHTATVRAPSDGEYGGTFDSPFTIEHVRLDDAARVRHTDYQIAPDTSGILFVDAINSHPAVEIPALSVIEIDGKQMTASVVHRVVGINRIHHWEIEVK